MTAATTQAQQAKALAAILNIIVDTVKDAGPMGAPSGPMYAALMAQGCTLSQYQSLMSALVRAGKLTQRGNLYFAATTCTD